MIYPKDTGVVVYGYFTASGLGATGLTVTFSLWEGTNGTAVINAQSANELAGGGYYYSISSGTIDANAAYFYKFVTAGTADQKEIAGIFVTPAWATNVNTLTFTGTDVKATLDSETVTVGTNNDKTGYGLADDAITASKFDETTAFPVKSADTGATAIARVGADSDTLKTLSDQLDTIVADTNELQTNQGNWLTATGFSTHSAADVWAVANRSLTTFGTLIADIWTYVTRSLTDKAGFTISGTKTTLDTLNDLSAAQVNAEVDTALADYDAPTKAELDSAVAPLATGANLAVVGGNVDDIKAVTVKLDTALELDGAVYRYTANALEESPAATGGDATAANQTAIINAISALNDISPTEVEDAVLDAVAAGHNTAGSIGAAILAAGSAGDPWITDPSDESTYPDGTAGYMITELSELLTASSGLIQAQADTDNLYIRRGDSWTQAFTLGDITGYDNIWFTVKKSHSDTDVQAVIQIDSDTGMIRLNGAAATALDGSITVTNVATGLISVAIKYGATEDLRCLSGLYYDIQVLIGTTKTTKYIGRIDVLYDVTKS